MRKLEKPIHENLFNLATAVVIKNEVPISIKMQN